MIAERSNWCAILAVTCTACLAPGNTRAAAQQEISAEPWFDGGTWMFAVHFAGVAFTDFQRAVALGAGDGGDRPALDRRVSARTTVAPGGWVGYWVNRSIGVRAGASWAPSSFTVRTTGRAGALLPPVDDGATSPQAELGILLTDVSVMLRSPIAVGRVVPWAVLGGGVVTYRVRGGGELPPEARSAFRGGRSRHGLAAVLGAGATVPLERWDLLLNFELISHLGRTPLPDSGDGEPFEVDGIPFRLAGPEDARTDGVGLTNHIRLGIGFTLPVR